MQICPPFMVSYYGELVDRATPNELTKDDGLRLMLGAG